MIKRTTNKETMEIESKIVDRWQAIYKKLELPCDRRDLIMDIDACHNNGCPLKLDELFVADDTNFAHDVFGIRANINHKTGKLENCFLPRYSK